MPETGALKHAEGRERLARRVLECLSDAESTGDAIRAILRQVRDGGSFEAVGLRLREGDDFPYYETLGFSDQFVALERSLCARDDSGNVVHDAAGAPLLECLCGNVLCGRVDAAASCFTRGGSFWNNRTSDLLPRAAGEARPPHTRHRCIALGYESIALVPLRVGGKVIGLLQINDHREGQFTPELVEYLEGLGASVGIALRRKQAEEELRESQRRLDLALRSARMGVWQWDIVTDRRHFDGCVCGLLGLDPATFRGTADEFYGAVHPDDRANLKAAIASAIEQRAPYEAEYRAVWPSGAVHHICTRGGVAQDDRGRPLRVDGVIWDITERKLFEEENAKLEAQLRQAQKMESVGRLAGGVAHDFNNMLFTIGSNAESALQQTDPSQPIHADLQEIIRATRASAELTRQLLAFARRQTFTPRALDLNAAVESTLKMLRRIIGEDITLEWKPGGDMWPVFADPAQIDQLLANLAVNARDAIADVGRITIETGTRVVLDAPEGAHEGELSHGDYVWLALGDNGSGMDEEALSHVFEPFFTTKGEGKGTGLGLATVYGIVKQNGGFVDVQSTPGMGARFVIYLPRHGSDTAQHPAPEAKSTRGPGGETILVVEDDPAFLRTIKRMLKIHGFAVLTAGSPGEAMRLAREHVGEIALLLTDMIMPEMNGRDLATQVLAIRPQIRRLFMSGYAADFIAQHGVIVHGVSFIQKPFSGEELAAKVGALLGRTPSGRPGDSPEVPEREA